VPLKAKPLGALSLLADFRPNPKLDKKFRVMYYGSINIKQTAGHSDFERNDEAYPMKQKLYELNHSFFSNRK
jgi:hypothetical protein